MTHDRWRIAFTQLLLSCRSASRFLSQPVMNSSAFS